jgi:SAM-dependent methyltransferase
MSSSVPANEDVPAGRVANLLGAKMLLERINDNRVRKFLDVGSADNIFDKFIKIKHEYFTLELPPEEWNERSFAGVNHSIYVDLDKNKIPVKNKNFDVIICIDVLEHTMSPQKVIDEFKRITKDDAFFVIGLPNEYNFLQRFNYLIGKKTDTELPWRVVDEHMHIHKPRVKDILDLMNENFEILDVKYGWSSRSGENNKFYGFIDKTIDKLSKISPDLFSREVVVLAKKKKNIENKGVLCRYCNTWNNPDRIEKECVKCGKVIKKYFQPK